MITCGWGRSCGVVRVVMRFEISIKSLDNNIFIGLGKQELNNDAADDVVPNFNPPKTNIWSFLLPCKNHIKRALGIHPQELEGVSEE